MEKNNNRRASLWAERRGEGKGPRVSLKQVQALAAKKVREKREERRFGQSPLESAPFEEAMEKKFPTEEKGRSSPRIDFIQDEIIPNDDPLTQPKSLEESSFRREDFHHKKKPFNRIRNFFKENFDFSTKGYHKTFLYLLIFLVLLGFVMVSSTSSYVMISRGESLFAFVVKQFVFTLLGFVLLYLFASFDYHRLNWKFYFYAFFPLIFLNLLPKVTRGEVLGAARWINVGPLSIQPSEFTKFIVVGFVAYYLAAPIRQKKVQLYRMLAIYGVIALFVGIIAVVQSNLSTAGILGLASYLLILLAKVGPVYKIFPAVVGFASGLALVKMESYRMSRISGFWDPFKDPTGETLQVVQSFFALSMGGFLGKGLGNSRLKAYWLPFAENDFIFAIICEELGLLGGLTVLMAFLFLVLLGINIARGAKDRYGAFLATGIMAVIGIQAAINMAVVMGAFPVTGVTLPFISAGGTSLVVNLAAMGVVLNIGRQGGKEVD